MKARLMYKTVHGLAPEDCKAFENANAIHDHILRGSSTRCYIPKCFIVRYRFLKMQLT